MPENYLVFSADEQPQSNLHHPPIGVFQAPARQTALSRGSEPSTSRAAGVSLTRAGAGSVGCNSLVWEDGCATQERRLDKLRRILIILTFPAFAEQGVWL
jgi:hypothetical protein